LFAILALFTMALPAAASTVVSWEYDQLKPAVAYSPQSQNYLVVWEDHHWGSGNDWDIYSRLVNNADVPVGSALDITSSYGNKQLAPDVAYNPSSGEFLVVWEDEFATTDHDIYAQRLGSDGSVLGGRITVTTLNNLESNPAVAYNAATNEYLIAWEHRTGSDEFAQEDIYGQRVAAAGVLMGSPVAIDTGSSDQLAPAIACGSSGECLVVWQDHDSSADFDIRGRRVGSDGGLIGSKIAISTWEYDQVKPRLAYNGAANQFLVVWEDHHWGFGSDWDVYGQRVNANGTLAGGNFAISWLGTNHRGSPDVAYKPAANEYLVVWEYEFSVTDHDVYRRRVASDATLPDDEAVVSGLGSNERLPAVESGGGGGYLTAWEDSRNAATLGVDIYAALAELPVLSGRVYAGSVGIETTPIGNVTVTLYCSSSPGVLGTSIASTTTDLTGWYGLVAGGACSYYNVVESDLPGYSSVGATTVSGTVINGNWIQYAAPLAGKTLTGNKFWDMNPPPTAAITAPSASAIVTGAVPIAGTASDNDLYAWVLRYGAGASPPSWNTISYGAAPVVSGTLGTWDTAAAGVPDGIYTLQLQVTDLAAQTSQASVAVTVDRTAPTAVIASPAGGAVVSGVVPVIGTANDAHLSSWVLEYGSGALPATWTTIASGNGSLINTVLGNWNTAGIANGSYTLRLRVTDLASLTSQYPVTVTLASPTATRTPTTIPTTTKTGTATVTRTNTAPPSPTPTKTATATPSVTTTNTPTRSPTPSPTPSMAPTSTATPSTTPTVTPTTSRTATRTFTPTWTSTSTRTPTNTPTPSRTLTPTGTYTATATVTPSPTRSQTASVTPAPSTTPTATRTLSATPTWTLTPIVTFTKPPPTATRTPSVTVTRTLTGSPTPTRTPTPTATATSQPTVAPTCGLTLGRWFNYGSGTPDFPAGYSVTSAAVDGQERLWVGTFGGGIAAYDGILWTRYTVASTAGGLVSDYVNVIAADGDEIWVGTGSGASRLDGLTGAWTTYTTANSGLPHNTVRAIAFADTGSAPNTHRSQFFATRNGLAQHFKSGTSDVWSVATTANSGLADNSVLDVAITKTNNYWIVTGGGVNRLVGNTWTTFTDGNTPGCGVIESATHLAVDDSGGRVWFGTDGTGTIDPQPGLGACMFNTANGSWRRFHAANSGLIDDTVKDLAVDTEGRVWFGTTPFYPSSPGGVSVCTWMGNDCYWRSYKTADGLASKKVSAVAVSLERLWFGTEDAGLSSFAPNWGFFDTDGVLALASLPGHVWVGTGAGLKHFDGTTWKTALAGQEIRATLALSLDDIWIGTDAGGVQHWDGVGWTVYNAGNSGLASNHVLALARDTRNRIWVGTQDAGVSVYNLKGKTWSTFNPANSPLPSNRVAAITVDHGQLWLGTDNGLAHFTGKSWTVYTGAAGLPSADIRDLGVDKAGNVWAATAAGPATWNGSTWSAYEPPAYIGGTSAVGVDAAGKVWLAGAFGVAVEDGAGGRVYRARNSGLINDSVGAITIDDGCAWFGTLHRFVLGLGLQGGLFVRGIAAEPLGAPVPTISGFSPGSGTAGTVVTINGTNFDPRGSNYITVEFRAAGFDHWVKAIVPSANSTQIAAKVPIEAMHGPIRVRTGGGTAVSSGNFDPIPRIDKLSTNSGVSGVPVDIYGVNFDSPSATVDVRFGTSAWVTGITPLQYDHIQVYVPPDATTGPVQVRNSSGTATSPGPFSVVTAGGLVIFGYDVTQGLSCFQCVSGKSTAVRVFVGASSTTSPAYVSHARLRVWRAGVPLFTVDAAISDGGVPNQGWFSNAQKQYTRDGSIDFFIPGSKLPASASIYTLEVEVYAGPFLLADQHFGNAYQFVETYPIRIHAAAPGPAPSGQQLTLLARNLAGVDRAFPVRDGFAQQIGGTSTGVQVAIESYNECDGTQMAHCKGTGFLWDFWQQNAVGQNRALIDTDATIGDSPNDGDKLTVNIGTVPKGGGGKLSILGRLRPASAFTVGTSTVSATVSIDSPDAASSPDWYAATSFSVIRPAGSTQATMPPSSGVTGSVATDQQQGSVADAPALRVSFDHVSRVTLWAGDPKPNPPNPGDVLQFEVAYQNVGTADAKDTVIVFDYDQAHMAMYGGGGFVRGTGGTIETQLIPGQFWAGTGFTGDRNYDCPLDENYDGVIDATDLPSFAVEFDHWDPTTGDMTVSTDFTKLAPGDVIRNFQDTNHNGRADAGEPTAPYVERLKNLPQLLFATPSDFFADYNKTHPSQQADVSALWFWGDGRLFRWPGNAWQVNYILGPGQGNANKQFWADVPSYDAVIHELGHVFEQVKTSSPHVTPGLHTTNKLVPLPYAYDIVGKQVLTGNHLLSAMWWAVQGPLEEAFFEPFEYFDMFVAFRDRAKAALPVASSGWSAEGSLDFYISGRVMPDDTALVSTSYLAENMVPTPADDSSGYRLRFLAGDRVVGEHRFPVTFVEPVQDGDEPPHTVAGSFSIVQPFPEGATTVEIRHDSYVLARLGVSTTTPWVHLLVPNGGESLDGTGDLIASWDAGDDDGDDLTYAVRYSADGGASWQTLMAGATAKQLRTPLSVLPGSDDALIEVEVSDGFHTATDRSDAPFRVSRKPPLWTAIVAPLNGSQRVQSESVTFAGSSFDPEDGMLADNGLTWTSSRDGQLGSGGSLAVFLSAGRHDVTLTGTDADGQSKSSTVSIDVLADFDEDGLADEYEQSHPGLEWWNPDDAGADADSDGLTNRGEADWGTDPSDADSDGDGVSDGDEVAGGSLPGVPTSLPEPARLMASRTQLEVVVPLGGPNPPAIEILLMSSTPQELDWTATVDAAGLSIDHVSGTTPSIVTATIDVTGLGPGRHDGELTFRGDTSEQVVEVHLDIVGPAITPTPHPTQTFVATPTPTPTATPTLKTTPVPCTGDCGLLDGVVSVDELVKGVNIALGVAELAECPSFDSNHDELVTVDELVRAVDHALEGCSGM